MTTHSVPATAARRRRAGSVLAVLAATSAVSALPAGAAQATTHVPAAPAAAAVDTPPAGHLTASTSACSWSGTDATCDLYAMAGTTTFLGVNTPIWGFSSSGATGSATAPGPRLVVHQGDTVHLVLHNQLAGQNVSLAVPGQATSVLAATGGDDTNGVATGSTRTYTFTAGRPGTFVYEAGHTPNGARQVAMGLAGALVVLPSDGTAYGTASTAYDDDAVLVLSEIDPALNANPAGFDMRNFSPKYRLINGKPFPESDEVSTGQGRTVLVRYVNVGSQTHAMSVLGGNQVEIAQGGHPAAYSTTLTAESIEPGQTVDTLVTMPTGPEAKLAVYEASAQLDNNGQHTADPLQTAFGGMMTFLDTAAPPPSTDLVGPVSTRVAASPNPSDGKAAVTVTADVSDATTGGSTVTQAELVIDDPTTLAPGAGTPMTGSFGTTTVTGVTGTISTATLDGLDAGKHVVYVRGLDSAGNWGVVGSVVLNLPKTGPQTTGGSLTDVPANGASDVDLSATGDDSAAGGTITAAEYFIDAPLNANGAPQVSSGSGTALTVNRAATVVSVDGTLPAATVKSLGEGLHHVYVHSKDSLGLWGPLLDIELPVDLTGPTVDAAAVGPNPTNGLVSDASNPGSLLISAQVEDLDAGNAPQSTLVAAEAFVDKTTGAGGSGLQLIAVDGKYDSQMEHVYGLIPLSQARALTDGTHHVYIRGEDAAGNWGTLFPADLVVDKTAPVLGALSATADPNAAGNVLLQAALTEANTLKTVEFWIGTTDPGAGKGTSLPVSVVNGMVVASAPVPPSVFGNQQFNLRVQDLAGNWSKPVSTTYTVPKANALFSDTFDSGTLNAWSARNGAVTSTTAARLVNATEPASTRGLQVTLGTAATRNAFVTDNTPAAETGYHVRFAFNRNTLNPGAAGTVLTLFQARTANGGSVFQLQYRVNAGTPQLRTVLGNTNGAWVNLAAGTHVLQLDWAAAVAGSVKLSIDGAVAQTTTGNTSNQRVESAVLGVTAGATRAAGSTGTAYFDSFVSTRSTLP